MNSTGELHALKLYDRELSGNAYKVRLLLAFLRLPYARIPIALHAGRNLVDDTYIRLNPRGEIPTLLDGEVCLWGSTAILCYLARRYDPARTWLPDDPILFGQVMQWLELAQNEIQTGLFRARAIAKFGVTGNPDAAHTDALRALTVLESRLNAAQWLAGPYPTIGDIACFPYVALAEEGGVDTTPYAGVCRWVRDFCTLERFVSMPGITQAKGA